jgi:hypothetical protein
MPLKNPGPPELWHWQQAVGWIGFDLSAPPLGFNIFDSQISKSVPHLKRRENATRALDELLKAANAKEISPMWLGQVPASDVLTGSEARTRMLAALGSKISLNSGLLDNLYFRREEIVEGWPAGPAAPSPTAAAGAQCLRWLRSIAESGELSQPVPGQKPLPKKAWWGKAHAQFPKLSYRSFESAWAEVARDHPTMRRAGRKRKSSQ